MGRTYQQVSIVVPPNIKAWLDRKKKDGFVVSRVVLKAIEDYMAAEEKGKKKA